MYLLDTNIIIYSLKNNVSSAIVNNYTLVTNNRKHFNRIEGLLLTD